MAKKLQQGFMYSSEKDSDFCKMRLDDIAAEKNKSISQIIVDSLVAAFLPKNKKLKGIVFDAFSNGEDKDNVVKNTVVSIFDDNCQGESWHSKHGDYRPLLDFCSKNICSDSKCSGTEDTIQLCLQQLTHILSRIKNCTEFCIENNDRIIYTEKLDFFKTLCSNLTQSPDNIKPSVFWEIISDYWDMLYDWSPTYRFLTALAKITDFIESPATRNALIDVIDQLPLKRDVISNTSEANLIDINVVDAVNYTDSRLEVLANGISVGTLTTFTAAPNQLSWFPNPNVRDVKFQMRNADTFNQIAQYLNDFKSEKGYKYLTIWERNGGYAAMLDKELIKYAGFKPIPDDIPTCYILE